MELHVAAFHLATMALHHFLGGCSHCGIGKVKSWHVMVFSAWWHCRMAKTQHVFCFPLQTISMAKAHRSGFSLKLLGSNSCCKAIGSFHMSIECSQVSKLSTHHTIVKPWQYIIGVVMLTVCLQCAHMYICRNLFLSMTEHMFCSHSSIFHQSKDQAMASDSSRPQKLAKLQQFKASLPYHSQTALHAMVQEAKSSGLPEVSSSKHQREARRELLKTCHGGALGPLIQEAPLQQVDGSPSTFVFTSLLTYLSALFSRGNSFQKLLASRHEACPSSTSKPWRRVMYLDELVPGNVLGRAERKSWAWYWYCSFLRFGQHLHSTDSWLTTGLARSNHVASVEAGVSQMTATLLKAFFCNPLVHPPTGFLLKHPEKGDIRLHFTFGMLLADGAARSKGDSGSIFFVRRTTEDQTHCNILQYNQLSLTTDDEVLESYARLDAKATSTKHDFDMWQQATGWNHSSMALMLDPALKAMDLLQPCAQFTHDYMHGVFQGTGPIVLLSLHFCHGGDLPHVPISRRLFCPLGFSQELEKPTHWQLLCQEK